MVLNSIVYHIKYQFYRNRVVAIRAVTYNVISQTDRRLWIVWLCYASKGSSSVSLNLFFFRVYGFVVNCKLSCLLLYEHLQMNNMQRIFPFRVTWFQICNIVIIYATKYWTTMYLCPKKKRKKKRLIVINVVQCKNLYVHNKCTLSND